jgi:predicted NAD/FAD-binding protein
VYFAGAWCSYGFHEDGIKAAVAAVGHLGVQVPWEPISTSPKMSLSQMFFFSLFDR